MQRLFSLARPVAKASRAAWLSTSSVRAARAFPSTAVKMNLRSFHAGAYTAAEVSIQLESLGDSITTATIVEWHKKPGEAVAVDDMIATVDTDKVSVDIKAKSAGVFGKGLIEEGEEVEVGADLYTVDTDAAAIATAAAAAPAQAPAATPAEAKPAEAKPAAATPAAAAPAAPAAAKATTTPAAAPSAPSTSGDRTETRVKMTRMRLRIAQRLKEAQGTAAMLTTFQECDMGNLIDMRNKYKEQFEKVHGVKLGFMSAFVQASTMALQEIPAVNGMIDDATKEIVYRNYVDVSVAVASPNGLVVPVLRNTENMSFADVEKTIGMYGKKAKEGNLALEEMAGGTFTISNGGTFGSLFGTPIINPPQSAILGMHATKMRAVVVNGKVEARPMMYLALTYDHRLIDGREAVTFLKSVANKIEDPSRLLLNL